MTPPPAPFIIEKDNFRLLFNQPLEQGCLTIENGSGGLCMFMDDVELEKLSKAMWYAAVRIRSNRKAPSHPSSGVAIKSPE